MLFYSNEIARYSHLALKHAVVRWIEILHWTCDTWKHCLLPTKAIWIQFLMCSFQSLYRHWSTLFHNVIMLSDGHELETPNIILLSLAINSCFYSLFIGVLMQNFTRSTVNLCDVTRADISFFHCLHCEYGQCQLGLTVVDREWASCADGKPSGHVTFRKSHIFKRTHPWLAVHKNFQAKLQVIPFQPLVAVFFIQAVVKRQTQAVETSIYFESWHRLSE